MATAKTKRATKAHRAAQVRDADLLGTEKSPGRFREELLHGPKDPERRALCENDPLRFCLEYLPGWFFLPFSEQHEREAEKLKRAIVNKDWFANADRRGGGKALALDTKIPTPDGSGWTTMGEIQVGDRVFDQHGNICNVTFATPIQYGRNCFSVEMSDGAAFTACEDHLWLVSDTPRKWRGEEVKSTQSLAKDYIRSSSRGRNEHRYRIKMCGELEGSSEALILDPYVFGIWLSEGTTAAPHVTLHEDDADEICQYARCLEWRRAEPESSKCDRYAIYGDERTALRSFAIGRKFIPSAYLRSSVKNRFRLLQGIMDGDGSVDERGHCELTLKPELARDACELIASLGFKYGTSERYVTLDGKRHGPYTRINFKPESERPVFRLKRKRDRLVPASKTRRLCDKRSIVGIHEVPSVPVRCIEVDSPTHTYLVGEKMVPTHNTTRSRAFLLWGLVYGHIQYAVYIGATHDAKKRAQAAILNRLMYSEPLREDFPEACLPFIHAQGKSSRAIHQLAGEYLTDLGCSAEQLVFANIPQLDYSKCNQAILDFASIQGELRGRNYARANGEMVRPDFVICDDPQTRGSAKSKASVSVLEDIIKSDVAYMAGPTKSIGLVVPCTVIYRDDLADRLLDNNRNPKFQGTRAQFMPKMPTNLDWWEEYRNKSTECLIQKISPKETAKILADFYLENREIADAGAEVAWVHAFREEDGEVSAIQHGMARYLDSESAFRAEYQNEPLVASQGREFERHAMEMLTRTNGLERQVCPEETEHLICAIDISHSVLWWTVMAISNDMTAAVVDYGVWPDQDRKYITLNSVQMTLEEKHGFYDEQTGVYLGPADYGSAVEQGLHALCSGLVKNDWKTESGKRVTPKAIVIDVGYSASSDAVYKLHRRATYGGLIYPSRGMGTTLRKPMIWNPSTKAKSGERRGHRFRIKPGDQGRTLQINTNAWKAIAHEAWTLEPTSKGAITLWKSASVADHQMFVDQNSVERGELESNEDTSIITFPKVPGADEHFWDNVVQCLCGSAIFGAMRPGMREAKALPKKKKRRRKLSDIARDKRRGV